MRLAMQVSGHGNFGSLDNDPPAAMRYTECRLQSVSSAVLLADLDFETVDFAPNFDGSQAQSTPSLLPTAAARLSWMYIHYLDLGHVCCPGGSSLRRVLKREPCRAPC